MSVVRMSMTSGLIRWGPGKRILCLLVILVAPAPFLDGYTLGLLVQAYIFAVLAISTDLAWGYSGILTFASAPAFGLGAYSIGTVFVHISMSGWSIPLAIAAGVLVTCVLSVGMGWLAFYSRTKVSEFYIAVLTLSVSALLSQAVLYGGAFTGGSNGLSGFDSIELPAVVWYLIASFALFVCIVLALTLVESDCGLALRAIRDNEVRCRYLGLNTPAIKTLVFVGCNGVAALAGAFYAIYSTVVSPSLTGITLATNVLIWVALGGRGTILGPVVAAVFVNAITPELSTTVPLYWQGLLGLLFVIVVVTMPRGLLPEAWHGLAAAARAVARWRSDDAGRSAAEHSWGVNSDAAIAISPDKSLPAPQEVGGVVLKLISVGKNYRSFSALTDASAEISRSELVSIVGPNGAGKTSLVRCITDGEERSSGQIEIVGQALGRKSPNAIVRLGVGRKFQSPSVFETLSVSECLRVASWKGHLPSLWRRKTLVSLPEESVEVVRALGLLAVWDAPSRDVSHGQRQGLELAMVLALQPSLLILDEPTAGLTMPERARVGELLTRIVDHGNIAVLLIEHDFNFVKQISTRIIVLHFGKILADGTVAEIAESKLVKEIYLGRSREEAHS
jgi:branched-chain amino acid transport system permease protein